MVLHWPSIPWSNISSKQLYFLSLHKLIGFPTWKLHTILNALTRSPFKPLCEVGLKWLRMKTIFLMAITLTRRISKLGALSHRPDLCIFHKDKVVPHTDPSFTPKVSSRFHRSQEICLPSFCPSPKTSSGEKWYILDMHRSLKAFPLRTETFRKMDFLFINISPPNRGKRMSTAAIGSVISCIREAYKSSKLEVPAKITAHSIRSAETNATLNNRASIEEICIAATWSSASTICHYRINSSDLADAAFSRRVLQQVIAEDDGAPPRS